MFKIKYINTPLPLTLHLYKQTLSQSGVFFLSLNNFICANFEPVCTFKGLNVFVLCVNLTDTVSEDREIKTIHWKTFTVQSYRLGGLLFQLKNSSLKADIDQLEILDGLYIDSNNKLNGSEANSIQTAGVQTTTLENGQEYYNYTQNINFTLHGTNSSIWTTQTKWQRFSVFSCTN